jgi:hypothetical protein
MITVFQIYLYKNLYAEVVAFIERLSGKRAEYDLSKADLIYETEPLERCPWG